MYAWVQVPMETGAVRSPGAGVLVGYEVISQGAGNWTQAVCKSSKYF